MTVHKFTKSKSLPNYLQLETKTDSSTPQSISTYQAFTEISTVYSAVTYKILKKCRVVAFLLVLYIHVQRPS